MFKGGDLPPLQAHRDRRKIYARDEMNEEAVHILALPQRQSGIHLRQMRVQTLIEMLPRKLSLTRPPP